MTRTLTVGLAFIFIIVAAVLSSTIAGSKKPAERKEVQKQDKLVKALPVKNQTITTRLEITGRLQAKQKVELFAEVGGTLLSNGNRFREGNYFKQGDTLFRIDSEEQKLNLLAQKSALMNQITLMLPDLKSDYPESFPAWESYLQKMKVDQPLAPFPKPASDRERYYISARNLNNLYYTIQSLETRMGKYTLTAPFNGAVSAANITEGTLVRIGQRLGELMNTWSYELEAAVYERDIELVKPGSKVSLQSETSDKSWEGTVARISKVIDPSTQTIKVFINVSGPDLKEGMYLSGIVKGREISNAFEIDRNLLLDQNQVYLIQDSTLSLKTVEPVYFSTSSVVVKGLQDNTLLMDQSIPDAYEGLKVGIISE